MRNDAGDDTRIDDDLEPAGKTGENEKTAVVIIIIGAAVAPRASGVSSGPWAGTRRARANERARAHPPAGEIRNGEAPRRCAVTRRHGIAETASVSP